MNNTESSYNILEPKESCKRILLLRNGNVDFIGQHMFINTRKYPRLNDLLAEINRRRPSYLPDLRANGQFGTKCLFSINGSRVTCLDQLKSEEAYVCCATNIFARINYVEALGRKSSNFHFYTNKKNSTNQLIQTTHEPLIKTIIAFLSGPKPRFMAKVTYETSLVSSINQIVYIVAQLLGIHPDQAKSIYSPTNKPIMSLTDLSNDISVIVLFTSDTISEDQFEFNGKEIELLCSCMSDKKQPEQEASCSSSTRMPAIRRRSSAFCRKNSFSKFKPQSKIAPAKSLNQIGLSRSFKLRRAGPGSEHVFTRDEQ